MACACLWQTMQPLWRPAYSPSSRCVRACVRACARVCVCARAHVPACVRACVHARVRVCVCVRACLPACVPACVRLPACLPACFLACLLDVMGYSALSHAFLFASTWPLVGIYIHFFTHLYSPLLHTDEVVCAHTGFGGGCEQAGGADRRREG